MTTAVTQCSGDCLVNDCVEVTSRSTTRESLLKPLARLLSMLMGSTKQASFHRSASGVEHEKHGCVWHFHGVVRGDHVLSPLWSTSELTVSDWVLGFLRDLQLGARNHHSYKCGMADATTSRVRARQVILRLLHGAIRQAP